MAGGHRYCLNYNRYPETPAGLRNAGDSDETIFVYALTHRLDTSLPRPGARPFAPYYTTVGESRAFAPRHASPRDDGFDAEERMRWDAHNPYYFVFFWPFAPDAARNFVVARFHLITRVMQMREALADNRATLREERDVHRELAANAEQSWAGSEYPQGATCRECCEPRQAFWWMVHHCGHSDIVLLL